MFEIILGPYQNNIKTNDKCEFYQIVITKSNDGHVGETDTCGPYILIKCGNSEFIYKQNQPFTINTDSIIILKAKSKLILFNKFMNLQLITLQLNKQFGYNKLTNNEFNNTKVLIIINPKFNIDLGIFDNSLCSWELILFIRLDNSDEILSITTKSLILIISVIIFIIISQCLAKYN